MSLFRCVMRADDGGSFVRLVQASSREQAILLLLAQGLDPVSVTHDVPSLASKLATRLKRSRDSARADHALPRLAATGLSVEAAVSAWIGLLSPDDLSAHGTLADQIAAGQPLCVALGCRENVPIWLIKILALAKNREEEQAILSALADMQSHTNRLHRSLQRRGAEGIVLLFVSILFATIVFPITIAGVIAIIAGIILVTFLPDGPIRGALRQFRAARMMAMMAIAQRWGADPSKACDLASLAICDARTRRQIKDNLTQFVSPLRLDLMIGDPLGLLPMESAILRYGQADVACRQLSIALTARLRRRVSGYIHILRLCALALAALALVTISR